MALPLLNNAEAQSSGTTALASNTGGPDANKFDIVSSDANGTITFDNTHPAHGSNAYKITQTGVTSALQFLEWNNTSIGAAVATINLVFYVWMAQPPANTVRLVRFFNGATLAGEIRGPTSGTGQIQFGNSADTAIGTLSTAMTTNTLYRLDITVTGGASGSGTARLFLGDSLTPLAADASFSATSFGTTFDKVQIGMTLAANSAAMSIWVDSIKLYTSAWPNGPGPYFFPAGSAGPSVGFMPMLQGTPVQRFLGSLPGIDTPPPIVVPPGFNPPILSPRTTYF